MDMQEFELEWDAQTVVLPQLVGTSPLADWDPPHFSDRVDLADDPIVSQCIEFELESALDSLMLDLARWGDPDFWVE